MRWYPFSEYHLICEYWNKRLSTLFYSHMSISKNRILKQETRTLAPKNRILEFRFA